MWERLSAAARDSFSASPPRDAPDAPPTQPAPKVTAEAIVCLFGVHFHNRRGNEVSWSCASSSAPPAVRRAGFLDGVEFKAMPSGVDKLDEDFVLFRQRDLYGLAVFSARRAASDARGAIYHSVGALATEHGALAAVANGLRDAAEALNAAPEGDRPAVYAALEARYRSGDLALDAAPRDDEDDLSVLRGSLGNLAFFYGRPALALTEGDRLRWRAMRRRMQTRARRSAATADLDAVVAGAFSAANDRVLEGLLVAARTGVDVTTLSSFEGFGLHRSDRAFLRALADELRVDHPGFKDSATWTSDATRTPSRPPRPPRDSWTATPKRQAPPLP
ncbi:DUF2347-containing protein [Aureococcus anophagefferens]|nr:DUF2347-containing protein [Aureococcus anophagefferens]